MVKTAALMLSVIVALTLVASTMVAATDGSDGLLFGGVFQISDPYCDYCSAPNLLSNSGLECGCPAGYTAWPAAPSSHGPFDVRVTEGATLLRVMTPCSAPMWHSTLSLCIASPNATLPSSPAFMSAPASMAPSEFAGAYHIEDGNGSKSGRANACRVPNPLTGDCSCPRDSLPIDLRVLTSATNAPVAFGTKHNLESIASYGSSLVMCARKQQVGYEAKNFGGAFQMEDSKMDGEASVCRVENPLTGSCSCAVGATQQTFRVMGPGGVATTVFLCGPKLIRSNTVELCPGVSVDNTGAVPIGNALAQCLFYHPNFLQPLDIPAGVYLMDQQVTLRGQLRTAGADLAGACLITSAVCATLRAAPTLNVPMFSSNGFILTHIILDGNKVQRNKNQPIVNSCLQQYTPKAGANAYSVCSGCVFAFNAFINAVCGSGFFLTGAGVIVTNNVFKNNGDNVDASRLWADGLTMTGADGSLISSNWMIDNTGSGLALGGGAGSLHVSNQVIMQSTGISGFGGLTFDTLHGFHFSEFRNTTIANNTIAGNGRLDFGLTMGAKPWYSGASPVIGGEPWTPVVRNTISGCAVNLNCDTALYITVAQNQIGDVAGKLSHCALPNSPLNISPDSRVDRSGETSPATSITYAGCVPGI